MTGKRFLALIFFLFSLAASAQFSVEDEIQKVVSLHFSDGDDVFSKIDVKYKNEFKSAEIDGPGIGYLDLPRIEDGEKGKTVEKISVSLFHRTEITSSAGASINQSLKKLYPGATIKVELFKTREVPLERKDETLANSQVKPSAEEKKLSDNLQIEKESIYEKNFGLILVCAVILIIGLGFLIAFSSAFRVLSSEISAGARSLASAFKLKTDYNEKMGADKIDEVEFGANLKMAKEIILDYSNLLPNLITSDRDVTLFKKTLPLLGFLPSEVANLMIPVDIRDKMNLKSLDHTIKKTDHQVWLQLFVENAIVNLSRASGPVLSSLGKDKKNKLNLIDKHWIEKKLERENDPLCLALCLELLGTDARKRFLKDHSDKATQILSIASNDDQKLMVTEEMANRLISEFEHQGERTSEVDFSLLVGESIDWILDYTHKLSLEDEEKYLRDISGDSSVLSDKIRAHHWTMTDFIREMGESMITYLSSLTSEEKLSLCVAGPEELRKRIYQIQASDKARVILADKVKKELEKSDITGHYEVCRKIISEARLWYRNNHRELPRAA